MNVTTKRDRIRGVASRWKEQYAPGGTWSVSGPRPAEVYERLRALDLNVATEDEVVAIVGNTSWTELVCQQCDASVDILVDVGEPRDYESHTVGICSVCAEKAANLIAAYALMEGVAKRRREACTCTSRSQKTGLRLPTRL